MIETRFKDTEIGKIPEDWELLPLHQGFDFRSNNTLSRDALSDNGFIMNIHYGDVLIKFGATVDVQKEALPYITNTDYKNAYYAEDGDIIIADTAEDETVGKATELLNIKDSLVVSGLHTMWLHPTSSNIFAKGYLGYAFNCALFHDQLIPLMQGTKVTSVSKTAIKDTYIAVPSDITEQSRIASALTSIDNLISSLDKLIEKKKNIKQGTMQQLLTGKKRLKGFTEPWVEQTLGSLGYFDGKSVTPNLTPNDIFCEYSMPAFDECQQPSVSKGSDMLSARVAIKGEVLLINKLNVRQKRIWYVKRCEDNAVCSGEFLPYKSTIVDLPLLRHILLTDKAVQDFIDMSTGTSNSQRRVRPKNILDYKVNIPIDKKEQIAIGAILISMDNEISALESKKAKYESMKQGMMQQLLTGKIRLI